MAELAGIIFGIAVPALHGIRLLMQDIGNIKDAPRTIKDVHRQLELLQLSIESLYGIEPEQWEGLGQAVVDQSRATLQSCDNICNDLRRRIRNWTKSRNGELTWREKVVFGCFKDHKIAVERNTLKCCRAELNMTINMATLLKTCQTGKAVEDMCSLLADRRLEIIRARDFAERGTIALNEEQTKVLRAKPLGERDKMCEEDLEEVEDDEAAMNEGLRICQTSQDVATELEVKLRKKFDEYNAGMYRQDNSITVTFGNNTVNNGILVGNNAGELNGDFHVGNQKDIPVGNNAGELNRDFRFGTPKKDT